MTIRILVEQSESGHHATAFDDVGQLASAAACDRRSAVEICKGRTLELVDGPVEWDVEVLNGSGR